MRRTLLALLLLAAALTATACSQEEANVLDRAFEEQVRSADASLELSAAVGGMEAFRFTAQGPYRSNGETQLDSFDWRIRMRARGQRTVEARVVSTGDSFAVEYAGTVYGASPEQMAAFTRGLRAERRRGQEVDDLQDLQRFGVDLRAWFPESATEADAEQDGVATRRVTGRLDVSRALTDIDRLLKVPAIRRQLEVQGPSDLSRRDIRRIDREISDPRFELQAGRDDGKLRRLVATLGFRAQGVPGQARFVLGFTRVDQPVRIAPLRRERPLSDLQDALEGTQGGAAAQAAA